MTTIDDSIEELCRNIRSLMPVITRTESISPRPVFIEFAGTPKAGKSFITERMEAILRHNEFRARRIPEAGSICPISRKDDVDFNFWTANQTLVNVLTELDRNQDQVIFLDRGVFDPLIWFTWMEMTGRLSSGDTKTICDYLLLSRWTSIMDFVFILTVDPKVAVSRDSLHLTGRYGRIMNVQTLTQLNEAIKRTEEKFQHCFSRILHIDTTDLTPQRGLETCLRRTLETLTEFLSERVITVSWSEIKDIVVQDSLVTDPKRRAALASIIRSNHKIVPRMAAEKDSELVQIIPCAVLAYGGKLFLLKRKEADTTHRLHDMYAIWAGGHARDRDAQGGEDLVYRALERELDEELSLRTQMEFEELGFILDSADPESRKHLCLCFLANLASPDVAIARDGREFRESKGRSLSGTFLEPKEIVKYWNRTERWSQIILRDHFKVAPQPQPLPL